MILIIGLIGCFTLRIELHFSHILGVGGILHYILFSQIKIVKVVYSKSANFFYIFRISDLLNKQAHIYDCNILTREITQIILPVL